MKYEVPFWGSLIIFNIGLFNMEDFTEIIYTLMWFVLAIIILVKDIVEYNKRYKRL